MYKGSDFVYTIFGSRKNCEKKRRMIYEKVETVFDEYGSGIIF